MRKKIIGLLMLGLFSVQLVQAQDATFRPHEAPAAEEWDSPAFTASRDTRLEWNAFPLPNAGDPQFAFQVIDDTGQVIDTRSGFEGMGFIEREVRVNLHVTCKQLYTWEIRVFMLKAPPVTSQEPGTTSEQPKESSIEDVPTTVTVTKEVTIVVYTELPPERYMVPSGYFLAEVLIMVVVLFIILNLLALQHIDVILARKAKEE